MSNAYDLIVIGGGPGGYLAAERGAHAGLKTLLFEKRSLGGVCLNEGCIPSKALLNSAKTYTHAKHAAAYGVTCGDVKIDQAAVVARKSKVVRTLVSGVKAKMKAHGVTVVMEEAKINGKTVTLDVASTIIRDRTMVPLRVIAETLDCSVDWIGETQTVLVNVKKNGREMSVYDRLMQTGLYYDVKDNRDSEHTRFLVRKDLVKSAPKESSPAALGIDWWIEAPNIYDAEQYPSKDCMVCATAYDSTTLTQIRNIIEMCYPTAYENVSALMMQTLRGEIWETRMDWHPAGFMTSPGTVGKQYYDQREVSMTVNGSMHTFSMKINTVGYVNPDKPVMLDANTVNAQTRDYQMGLWPEDRIYLNLK
jgi:ribulose 1,5-bisphosphate synthetase/thiazole synthase